MSETRQDVEQIEGTYVFDGALSRKGYRLNKFFFALNKPENRAAYKEDAEALMDRFGLSEWEKEKLREKDWLALAREGGANIYFMYKMGSVTGDSPPAYRCGVPRRDVGGVPQHAKGPGG